jgi:hypothetical protein
MKRIYEHIISTDSEDELIEALTRCMAAGWKAVDDPVVGSAVRRNPDGSTTKRNEYFQRVFKVV